MDSYLVRLVRGEGGTLWPSAQERLLLKFALDNFGEPLSQLLLAGLGEEEETHNWLFTVTFRDKQGAVRRREIRVETDAHLNVASLLPCGRQPLVILALLRLLIGDRKLSSANLSYEQEEVLSLLGWEDTVESRLTVDQSVERYDGLSYNWKLSNEELVNNFLSYYQGAARIVSGYGYQSLEDKGQIKRVSNEIDFNLRFVNRLIGHSLFDVNWNNINSLERSS